jgi:hypothetical protein
MKEFPRPLRLPALLWLVVAFLPFLQVQAAPPPVEISVVPFHCETAIPPTSDLLESWARRRATPASAWTEGRKRLLLVRVDFSDLPGQPFTPLQGTNLITDMDRFYSEMSYGKMGFHLPGAGSDYTPVLRMPLSAAVYGVLDPSRLRTDALTIARTNGFDATHYDLDVICTGNVTGYKFTGLAYVGLRGAWVKNSFANAGPIAHEIGHNLGLNHANFWDTSGLGPIGPGKEQEYGDSSDTMSLSTGYSRHFNARSKEFLNWLSDAEIASPTSSGVVRLFAHDSTNAAAGPRAIRIARNSRTNYWFEFRTLHTNAPIAASSLGIRWADNTNRATLFIDTTPWTIPGVRDGFLRPGRTFSDPVRDLHVTTLARTNTTPPALDVDVQFGPFPGNQPPTASLDVGDTNVAIGTTITFNVSATDPDGDALAYGWDPGDESIPANEPSFTRTFGNVGEFIVQCVISDRRGGTATVRSIVRVGEPAGWRVTGTIRREDAPFDGASVVATTVRTARSDNAGTFAFVGLTNGPQTLRPYLEGHAFVPGRTNITVADANLGGIDFTAYRFEDLQSVDLSPSGANWRYLDNGTDPGVNWKNNSFVDTAWKSGDAPLGYGMPGLATTVSFGPNPAGKWVTTYFRRAFNTPVLNEWLALRIHLQRDDGAIVYLNGTEVARSNMKDGTFTFLTFAAEDTTGAEEQAYFTYLIDPAILRSDRNVIAVEVHQYTVNTPDCRFDLRVEGLRVPVLTAPTFTTTPTPQTVVAGQSAAFTALAIGTEPIGYAWLRNGTPVSGAALPILNFPTASTNDAGAYQVIASNSAGSVTSAPVTLTVLLPPTFATAPTPQTVVAGQPALFTTLAIGTDPIGYAWLRNGTPVSGAALPTLSFPTASTNDAGAYQVIASNSAGSITSAPVTLTVLLPPTFTTTPTPQTVVAGQPAVFTALAIGTDPIGYTWLRDGTPVSGAALPTLNFPAASTNDAGAYQVIASNSAGSVTSAPVTLTVLVPPTFTTAPTPQTVVAGQPAVFTALATGTDPIGYTWLRDGTPASGATLPTLNFPTASTNDAGAYQVIASNSAGSVTSAPVTLTVLVPPTFATTPTPQTVVAGQPALFTALAIGTDPIGYTWLRDGTPVSGATLPTLYFPTASTNDAGAYQVIASNSAGSVTSAPVTLTVLVPPTFATTPTPQTVVAGQPAAFTALAIGTDPIGYAWLRDGTPVSGAALPTLSFPTASTNDAGAYQVIASNSAGSVTSAPVSLTVLVPPTFTTTPTPQTVIAGQPAAFTALATGTDPIGYTWLRNGTPVSGAALPTLSFPTASTNDAGAYQVIASNSAGSVTSAPVTLTVLLPPTFATTPTPQTVVAGQPAVFTALATGTDPIGYTWLRDGTPVSGAALPTLNFPAASTNDAGAYQVIASNSAGSITSAPVTLTVLVPPTFTTTPTPQTVVAGQPAVFTALATGTDPIGYTWLRNGSPVSGAALPMLIFPTASTNDAGAYQVIASNSAGSVTSAPVTLTVLVPPTFTTAPTPQTVVAGQPAVFTALATGTEPIGYAWLRNGTPVSGAALPTLSFPTASTNDAGAYQVIASNSAGSVTSAPVALTVLVPPSIVTNPTNLTVASGESARFQVVATGSETLRYQWLKDGVEIDGATSSSLEWVAVAVIDAGIYTVRISNDAGSRFSDPASLTVTTTAEAAHLTMVRSDLDPDRLFLVITGTPGARYRIEHGERLDEWMPGGTFVMPGSGTNSWEVATPLRETRLFRVVSVP